MHLQLAMAQLYKIYQMKEQKTEQQYIVGEYLDYSAGSNLWCPKLLLQEEWNDQQLIFRIKDPRHYLASSDHVIFRSQKFRPFRTFSSLKTQLTNSIYLKSKKLDTHLLARNQTELEEFLSKPLGKPPREIIQFLRGRHYFYAEELVSSQFQEQAHYTAAMRYFATHRSFMIAYLRTITFSLADADIYSTSMSALCSAFPELFDFTLYAVGVASDFDAIRKENQRWHNQTVFHQEITGWVEREFFPALMESRHEEFPPSFIFSLFNFMNTLFNRAVTSRSSQLSDIYEMIFEDLKRNLHLPFTNKDLNNFETNADAIFRQFKIRNIAESSPESSQTQQIQMAIQSISAPGSASREQKEKQTILRDELAKLKKIQFKLCLVKAFLQKGDNDRFLKETLILVNVVIDKVYLDRYQNENQWPSYVKYFVNMAREMSLAEKVLSVPDKDGQQDSNQRGIILKLQQLMPKQVIELVVQHEKIFLVKHLLQQPNNRNNLTTDYIIALIDKLIIKSQDAINPREYLQFFNSLERIYKNNHSQGARLLRIKLMHGAFDLAIQLNSTQNKILIDGLMDLSDPLKEQQWAKYTAEHILNNTNDIYYYFYEISINKYLQKYSIDLETFRQLCEFMRDSSIHPEIYKRRKVSVIHALNFQYRFHKSEYLSYLDVFLDAYTDTSHDRDEQGNQWSNLYPFPIDDKTFLSLPIDKNFCYNHLQNLDPLYFQTDIAVYLKLFLKVNILQGKVIVNEDEIIMNVVDVPVMFADFLSNFFGKLQQSRMKLIQKQIEKYFYAAVNEQIYNAMLLEFLQVIIQKEARRTDIVNMLFKRLKVRNHLIIKSSAHLGQLAKTQQVLICRNTKIYQNCEALKENVRTDCFFMPFLMEETNKIQMEIPLNKRELLSVIRARMATKLNREPADIILYFEGRPLEEQRYSLSFQDVYFQQPCVQGQGKTQIIIQYQFNPSHPPIRLTLINNIDKLYNLLPNTLSILKGVDLIQQDWSDVNLLRLNTYKRILQGNLQRNDFMENDFKVTHKFDFLLDFYIWKLDHKQTYNFKFLLRMLRRIQSVDYIKRNYKIIYLVHRSSHLELSFEDCQQMIMCLLPDDSLSPDKLEKMLQTMNDSENYQTLEKLVSILIESAPYCLQFISTCNYYPQFTRFQNLLKIYRKLWNKIYLNASLNEKIELIKNFQFYVVMHPDNLRDFYTIITYEELTANTEFYQQVILQFTILLLSLDKDNLTLSQFNIIEILIINISQLADQNRIFHPILHSRALVQFVKKYIYQLSQQTQAQLLNIIKIMIINTQNRAILTDFFAKQSRETEWLQKNLQRPFSRYVQFQGRVGLQNPHSICYANSVLQQLFHIEMFRDQIINTPFTQNPVQDEDLIYQIKKIFLNLQYGREVYLNPNFFKAFKTIDGEDTNTMVQMDADEFRNLLLQRIQNAIPSTNNFVKKIFEGKQISCVKSQQCDHVSSKSQQVFTSLCVQVKGVNNLQQSLDCYLKPQILSGDNAYFCQSCQRKLTAEKSIKIQILPPYLTFVLKRFEFGALNRFKVNSYFEFPVETPLEYFPGKRYFLKGVIVHAGVPQTGHYVSFAKHNNVWYLFNDSFVSEADISLLKQASFGKNPNAPGYRRQQAKNAYLLIYEAQDAQKRQEKIERTFFGVVDQHKKIVKNQILLNKERLYFTANYLETLNCIVDRFNEPASIQLLFWTLMTIHIRLKRDVLRPQTLEKSLKLIKRNKTQFKFLWSSNQIDRAIQVFTCQMNPEYKSVFIQLLVDNCQQYTQNVQNILQLCLKRIYSEQIDHSGYFIFMHWMAKKFPQASNYLNEQRIVGRILDLLLSGIVGQTVRKTLKQSCDVQFQGISFSSKNFKDHPKSPYKYHKWALMVTILQNCNLNLHQIQKQHYVFQGTNFVFDNIFADASDKPTTKFISKYFSILCKLNKDYCQKLVYYISEQLKNRQDSRRYLKTIRDICFISDQHAPQRNKNSAALFHRYLKRLYEQRKQHLFLSAWQWLILLIKTNNHFRKKINEFSNLFSQIICIQPSSLISYKGRSYETSFLRAANDKHPLYGIMISNSIKQTQSIIAKKNEEMRVALNEQQFHDPEDYDGDIIYRNFEEGQILLKYEQSKLKFSRVVVRFQYGDLLILQQFDKKDDSTLSIYSRGDEKLRLKTEAICQDLIIEYEPEKIELEDPRQI